MGIIAWIVLDITVHGSFSLSTRLTVIAGAAVLLLAYHPGKHRAHPAPGPPGAPVTGLIQPAGTGHATGSGGSCAGRPGIWAGPRSAGG